MDKIIKLIAGELDITEHQVLNVVTLFESGATIPFISRYRKEMTGSLDEVMIERINELFDKYTELEKRKEFVITAIEKQKLLNDDIKARIFSAKTLNELEDIYLPYKPKRKTRAEVARKNGLEPLAKIIMSQKSTNLNLSKFINETIATENEAIAGAKDIIAEWVSENSNARSLLRKIFEHTAVIKSRIIKGKEIEADKYTNYFDFSEPLRRCSSHRLLAMRRGEAEGFLRVSIVPEQDAVCRIKKLFVHGKGVLSDYVSEAVDDAFKRLLCPSIENEFNSLSKMHADEEAINIFKKNLRSLLLAPPLGKKRVLAIDPGFRTGCKVVCLDEQGALLDNVTIYPHSTVNEQIAAKMELRDLIAEYRINAIAIGRGTAGRETKSFIESLNLPNVEIYTVNEDGASIYSASQVARDEFPNYDVTVRGAVSIGRRLMDPLAELVKIEPKSLGVGQYQHDVDQTKLKKSLDMTVESCVNSVGINLNTASKQLLSYVSGLGKQLASNIVDYRNEKGAFKNRNEIKRVARLGEKAFEQCAAFLRIPESDNPLDNTAVHPERYALVEQMAKDAGCGVSDLISNKQLRNSLDISNYIDDKVGNETLRDIMTELDKPGRDPREDLRTFEFEQSISDINDLKPGMILPGIVSNVTAFGCFVELGIKVKGLVHISQLSDKFVKDPATIVKTNQRIIVKVIDVDVNRLRIALSMKDVSQSS